jgi:DNA-binding LacI/PurR family transcriptional regulator
VLPDLRGYGDSSLPEPGPDNVNFSFREMARDLIEVMHALGHERFMVAGHAHQKAAATKKGLGLMARKRGRAYERLFEAHGLHITQH